MSIERRGDRVVAACDLCAVTSDDAPIAGDRFGRTLCMACASSPTGWGDWVLAAFASAILARAFDGLPPGAVVELFEALVLMAAILATLGEPVTTMEFAMARSAALDAVRVRWGARGGAA